MSCSQSQAAILTDALRVSPQSPHGVCWAIALKNYFQIILEDDFKPALEKAR
jgi:hypothetical protein